MSRFLLRTTSATALLAALSITPPVARADTIAQPLAGASTPILAKIGGGPWTLSNGPASKAVPYAGYCAAGAQTRNTSVSPVAMQPYYFPSVISEGGHLRGFFDYRPRNAQEAVVTALSYDFGQNWWFYEKAAALDYACPADPTDGNNVTISVGRLPPVANEVFDNGQGHPFALKVGTASFLYTLDRSNADIDVTGLIVHRLAAAPAVLSGIAKIESVGIPGITGSVDSEGLRAPLAPLTYTTGLKNPDAILGVFPGLSKITVLYVSKVLGGDMMGPTALPAAEQCGPTPSFAITAGRAANHDFVTQRLATTTDGIHFTDLGPVAGLADPTTTSFHGIRYLGSGSVFPLADSQGNYNGRYGLLFGAGNCLDGDSDGFHFAGYAVTTTPGDLLHWQVLNGLDNPIISTGQIIDTGTSPGTVYPAHTPLADLSDWPTPAATNFYHGRVYGPAVAYRAPSQLSVVFAGYNTPQPKKNLGNYRSIGSLTVTLPPGVYVHPF